MNEQLSCRRRRRWRAAFLLTIGLCGLPGCGGSSSGDTSQDNPPVVMKGDRILSMAVFAGSDDNYANAFALGQALGMQSTSLALPWDELETAPGIYDSDVLAFAETFFPAVNTTISLEINPIDTVKRRMPDDLASLPFNDPEVIGRYENLLDWVFSQIPDVQLTSLTIGNEVDDYLNSHPEEWPQYRDFYQQVSAHARTLRPGLKVGVKAEFAGLVGNAQSNMQMLNQYSDVVEVTYYPLDADFTVQPPTVVSGDFDTLASLYPGRIIYVLEAGYPSSTECGGSEVLQAAFIDQVFRAWDAHADQIKLISFFAIYDFSPEFVELAMEYYGLSSPCFAAYLGSLGLITYNGRQKPAYLLLGADAAARGW
ncbi:MAG: hypothetical protein L0I62_08525 [Gammaproteobacteria bacterium]|nr:hypothetical protein [Gammaproteobacteria bacterium]